MPTGIGLREENSFPSEVIHVRRGNLLRMIRIEADVGVTLIVREDNDDVWRYGRGQIPADEQCEK